MNKLNIKQSNYFKNREKELFVKEKQSIASLPRNALVEVTNACNHACVFCFNPRMKRKIKTLPLKKHSAYIPNLFYYIIIYF